MGWRLPTPLSLADLREAPGTRTLWIQFLSFSCSFREKFWQIIGLHPNLRDWRPPSGKSFIPHCIAPLPPSPGQRPYIYGKSWTRPACRSVEIIQLLYMKRLRAKPPPPTPRACCAQKFPRKSRGDAISW